jgi:hypothetical protein
MSNINTLLKVTNKMKEEGLSLHNIEVVLENGNKSTCLYDGKIKHPMGGGFQMGRGCPMFGRHLGNNNNDLDHFLKMGSRFDKVSMGLKALNKLDVQPTESGKLLSLDMEVSELPKAVQEQVKAKIFMIKQVQGHMADQDIRHPQMEKILTIKQELEAAGINFQDLDIQTAKLKALVDKEYKVMEMSLALNATNGVDEAVEVKIRKYA